MSGIYKPYGASKMRAEGTWKLFIWSLSAKFDFRHFQILIAESMSQSSKRISRIQGHRRPREKWWLKKFQVLLGQLKYITQILLPKMGKNG